MKHFLAKIVNLMKDENLFASQGGPIILSQVASSYVHGSRLWKFSHQTLKLLQAAVICVVVTIIMS